VIIGEAHLLHLTIYVFFARSRPWVAEWDNCVLELLLLPSMVHIHIVDIKSILCQALMCRGWVKYKDRSAITVGVVEDSDCISELVNQLGEIPPWVKVLSRISNLSSFKRR
jgi:hypothetical protein